MVFSKFSLEYYRGFQDTQTLEFGIPNGKEGSGITYVVGENNSGKTTVIEGLLQQREMRIRGSERSVNGPPIFQLYDQDGTLVRKVGLLRETAYSFAEDPQLPVKAFEIIPSRRHWESRVNFTSSLEGVLEQVSNTSPREYQASPQFSGALKSIESDRDKYPAFIALIKEVLPEFHSFAIAFEESEYVEYTTTNSLKHRSEYLGDGVISILRVLAHLFLNSDRVLVVDEPELSLHPLAQKRLYSVIARYSTARQIIVSTHSPYFISWEHIKNGAKLNKISKHGDLKSEINSLNGFDFYEHLLRGANWQQPFLMDVVAKEIFFHDNFLFVEGQEDVGLLLKDRKLATNINLFGYGVRGKDSFKFALQLAKDLGIKKAGVILDAGGTETTIKADLERSFPEYKIIQWNKEDIRDKPARTSGQKVGYFTSGGSKKDTDQLDDYEEKIESINQYFI